MQRIANQQGIEYLDLYPLFTDRNGDLSLEFTTDGLHLNPQGYTVWRTALALKINSNQTTGKNQIPLGGRI